MWLTNLPSMEPPIPVSLSLMLRSFIYTLNSRGDKMNENTNRHIYKQYIIAIRQRLYTLITIHDVLMAINTNKRYSVMSYSLLRSKVSKMCLFKIFINNYCNRHI